MSVPSNTHEYRLSQAIGVQGLTFAESILEPPKAHEVLVKIHAVSLNYRDLVIAKGNAPHQFESNVVPGSDMAGEVVSVGSDVKKWQRGDRVSANFTPTHIHGDYTAEMWGTAFGGKINGVLTEYKNFSDECLVRIPEHLTYEEASTLPCAGVTAYNALLGPVPLKGGDTVLVLGTGGVSIFALQIAAASGATVIVTSSSDKKLEVARSLGAHYLINYNTTPNWDEEVLKLTNGRGVDHVIEIGGPGTLRRSYNAVCFSGWVHAIGFLSQAKEEPPSRMHQFKATLRGILVGSRTQFEALNKLFASRKLHPVVDRVFSFDKAREAYEYLESQAHIGKVVIKVSSD